MIENNNAKYIGITIGPIIKTLSTTSKLAGLSDASRLFSTLSRLILEQLTGLNLAGQAGKELSAGELALSDNSKRIELQNVVLPCLATSKDESESIMSMLKDAAGKKIGLFPDRIIIKNGDPKESGYLTMADIDAIADFALNKICTDKELMKNELEDSEKEEIKDQIIIYSAEFFCDDKDSPILIGNSILSNLELEEKFVPASEDFNIMNRLFAQRKGTVDLGEFSKISNNGLKINNYFAIVNADGDNIGKCLSQMGSDIQRIQDFSYRCFKYALTSSNEIINYGGEVIYAGGDDLLFLAPLSKKSSPKGDVSKFTGETLLDLLKKLNEIFNDCFSDLPSGEENVNPSLSVGCEICYHAFPLYEALNNSRNLLFGEAKGIDGKNAFAINLRKHSGQMAKIILPNFSKHISSKEDSSKEEDEKIFDIIIETLNKFAQINDDGSDQNEDAFLSSVPTKLSLYGKLFEFAVSQVEGERNQKAYITNLFNNIFDDDVHKLSDVYINNLREITTLAVIEGLVADKEIVQYINSLIRLIKFYVEKADEKEKEGNANE